MDGDTIGIEKIVSDSESINLDEISALADINLNDNMKAVIDIAKSLEEPPTQPEIAFPKSQFAGQLRSFNEKYYKLYPWIEYTILEDSVYCYPCRFFNFSKSKPDQIFIKRGFKNWKRASEKTLAIFNMTTASFTKGVWCFGHPTISNSNSKSVGTQINSAHHILVKENRES